MRLKVFPAGSVLTAGSVAEEGEAGERSAVDGALLGSWSATRWHYTSRSRPEQMIDVVCDLRGTVTLSLSAGTFVLTWDVPGRGGESVGGRLSVRGDELVLLALGARETEPVTYRLAAETLSLSSDTSAWDFDGGADEPAAFVGVMVRL